MTTSQLIDIIQHFQRLSINTNFGFIMGIENNTTYYQLYYLNSEGENIQVYNDVTSDKFPESHALQRLMDFWIKFDPRRED